MKRPGVLGWDPGLWELRGMRGYFSLMASAGHSPMQVPHSVHSS